MLTSLFPRVVLTIQPGFVGVCHSKADYQEQGPRIARHNAVFAM